MGIKIFKISSDKLPRREWYPSGPWVNGVRPDNIQANANPGRPDNAKATAKPKKKKTVALPNPDPSDYQIVKAQEIGNILIIKVNYPACTNFEGNKILVFRGINLIGLTNQRFIDPHFFEHEKYASPIARFVPTDEGWDMAVKLAEVLTVPR